MKIRDILILAGVVGAVLFVLFVMGGWGFLKGKLETAQAETETGRDTIEGFEQGAAAQGAVDAAATNVYLTVQNATEATHDLELQANAAPDVSTPLGERGDRLRANDEQLLGLWNGGGSNGGAGGAPEGGDAGSGPGALPTSRPAAEPDAG